MNIHAGVTVLHCTALNHCKRYSRHFELKPFSLSNFWMNYFGICYVLEHNFRRMVIWTYEMDRELGVFGSTNRIGNQEGLT